MKNGQFIVSLDFELFWGLAGFNRQAILNYKENVSNAINALDEILKLFNKYQIKVSIAYVGGMSLSSAQEFLDNYSSPEYENKELNIHTYIKKYSDIIDDSLLVCSEYLKNLLNNRLVELGTHTFSHFYCLERGASVKDFAQDMQNVMAHQNNVSTIIFPRNQVSQEYLQVCKYYGITHYRGFVEDWLYKAEPTKSHFSLKGALRLIDSYLPISGNRTFFVKKDADEIKNVPGSLFLRPYSKKLSFLEPLKVKRIKYSMRYAAKNGKCFHLWWHPHNFGCNMQENLHNLEEICKYFTLLKTQFGYSSSFIKEH